MSVMKLEQITMASRAAHGPGPRLAAVRAVGCGRVAGAVPIHRPTSVGATALPSDPTIQGRTPLPPPRRLPWPAPAARRDPVQRYRPGCGPWWPTCTATSLSVVGEGTEIDGARRPLSEGPREGLTGTFGSGPSPTRAMEPSWPNRSPRSDVLPRAAFRLTHAERLADP